MKQNDYESASSHVSYNPDTGIFVWKFRDGKTQGEKMFNSRYAGLSCEQTDKDGYIRIGITINRRRVFIRAHRLAWFISTGKMPQYEIDHIDGNPSNNQISNLRDVLPSVNMRNQSMMRNNKSGVTGVYWNKERKKWRAQATVNGKDKTIGSFSTISDAELAVKEFRALNGFTNRHGEMK